MTINDSISALPPDELLFVSSPSLGLSTTDTSLDELMVQRLIARREGCSYRCLLQENLSHIGRTIDPKNGSWLKYSAIKSRNNHSDTASYSWIFKLRSSSLLVRISPQIRAHFTVSYDLKMRSTAVFRLMTLAAWLSTTTYTWTFRACWKGRELRLFQGRWFTITCSGMNCMNIL